MSLFVLVIEGGTLGTGVKVKVNLKGIERKVTYGISESQRGSC